MAVRVNKAKKFNGKSYVGTDALDTLIQSFAINGNTLTFVGASAKVEGDDVTAKTIDLSGLVGITSGGTLISVSSNNINAGGLTTFVGTPVSSKIVTTDGTGKLNYANEIVTTITNGDNPSATGLPTESAVKAYVDGHGISLTSTDSSVTITQGEGVTKNLATNLYIKKLGTADTGYAATYQLQIGNGAGADPIGDKIQILKDQFLKEAEFIASATSDDVTNAGGQGTAEFAVGEPVIKFTMELTGTDSDTDSYLYVPVKELVDVYTAGNYIDGTAIQSNEIKVNVGNGIDSSVTTAITVKVDDASEKVYTAKNTSSAVLSVGADGVKVNYIQAAIDNAVTAEHVAASAAIETLESQVSTFETATNTAVGALNTRIETVATNAVSAINVVSAAVSAVDSKVDAKIDAVNNNVETAIGAVITSANTAISDSVGAINANVSAVASGLNSRIGDVATNAQSAANALEAEIVALDTKVDGAFSALDTAVENAIDAVETSVSAYTANAVQMLESTVTVGTSAVTSGVASVQVTANNIVAVYDPEGIQIYPEITRPTTGTKPYIYTLKAEYGTATPDATWTVLYTLNMSAYTSVTVADTDYSVTNSAAKTVGGGTEVDYSNATASAAEAPTFTKADYETTTIGAIAVGSGTAATAPTVNADVEKAAPDYKPAVQP